MINRIPDKEAIETIYHEFSGKSALLIIYAKTGIGKSFLIDNVFSEFLDRSYVRVQINQQQAEEAKGFYLSCLSKALNTYAHETNRFSTIERFVDSIYRINNNTGEKAINDLLDIAAILIHQKDLRDKAIEPKKFKEELIKKVLESDNDIAISFLLEYILYISKESKIILIIENIQQANSRLISFLNELLRKTENMFFVCEYTINNSELEVTTLFKQFPYERTSVYELKKLDKQELLGGIPQITEKENVEAIREIIENSYDESPGNLANLQFLLKKNTRLLNRSKEGNLKTIKFDNALHSVYNGLTNNQRMFLWYIVAHLGKVYQGILKLFAETELIYFDLQSELQALHELKLLKLENNYVYLFHDSMIELLKEEEDSVKFSVIANQAWLNFYRNIATQGEFGKVKIATINLDDLLILQLTFILNIGGSSNIDWMNVILSKINKSLNSSFSNSLIEKVINIFYQVIHNSENQKLLYKTYEWIIVILSKLGYWEEVAKIVVKYKPTNQSDLVNLLQATARVATCDVTVGRDLEAITDKTNSFLYTGAQLLLLRYFRTFNRIKKARHIWKELLATGNKTPYQNIIIDQVNLCSLNYRKRQRMLEHSKRGHYEKGNIYQYCSTLLNINSNLCYLYYLKLVSRGKFLRIASENIKEVKNLLAETHYPVHVYINQKSVFQYLENNTPPHTLLENFQRAYLSCGISGNKPLIGSNIVVVGLKYNNLINISEYVEDLMLMSRKYHELNSEFAKYPLVNCYNYYRKINDRQGQKEVLRLFQKTSSLNSIGDYFIATPLLNELALRAIKNYPCNIWNWDIDFESIQKEF